MTRILFFLTISLASLSAHAATDQERAERAIETRQGLLEVVAHYFGPIVGMARGQIPYDAELVQANAGKIAQLAPMITDVFTMDTRSSGLKSDSLDGIWDNYADFSDKADTATMRALALSAAAQKDQGAAMKAFGALGSACKNCHESYREK